MISNLQLKFGPTPNAPNLSIDTTSITVFVGPNNSGKSRLINEISSQCLGGHRQPDDLILSEITFAPLSQVDAEKFIENAFLGLSPHHSSEEYILFGQTGSVTTAHRPSLLRSLQNPNDVRLRMDYSQHYLGPKTVMLNTLNRIDLINDQAGGDLQNAPQTTLQRLFRDDELREKYSAIIHRSFGAYAVVDPTNLGQLRLRLSTERPPTPEVERGLSADSIAFHASARHISQISDGVKAFSGILAAVMAGDPKVLLMDEPEAFLHPALAFNLGREVGGLLLAAGKRMFVSTHSPQFLMGCIQSGVPINVIRLTYRDGVATARLLPSSDIIQLMRNPLLRSTGVISALFYESAVVTEADPDRAFYQEINERLLKVGRGVPNCVFLNAQNKQTIPTILGPLRSLGIPAAAIYDIDFVKDGGGVATNFMKTAGIPQLAQQGLTTTRASLANKLLFANSHYKTSGGITVLDTNDQDAASDFFDHFDGYGAFVVRHGELESWLKPLGINGHGPGWLIQMFERMGEDPTSADYVKPANDDVWKFMDGVATWLANPLRKGIPA